MAKAHHAFLTELLDSEDGRKAIGEIWTELRTKRRNEVLWHKCRKCKDVSYLDVELYKLKDVMSFLSWAAAYGVGKPPEKKEIQVEVGTRKLGELSDDELDTLIAGSQPALPAA